MVPVAAISFPSWRKSSCAATLTALELEQAILRCIDMVDEKLGQFRWQMSANDFLATIEAVLPQDTPDHAGRRTMVRATESGH